MVSSHKNLFQLEAISQSSVEANILACSRWQKLQDTNPVEAHQPLWNNRFCI